MLDLLAVDPEKLINPFDHPLIKRVPRPTVYRWLVSRELSAIKMGKRWFSTHEAIVDFIRVCNERKAKTKPAKTPKRIRKAEIEAAESSLKAKARGAK